MRRPYDLRHSGITWRLNSGVPPTEIAAWAGHSVEMLLRVYARCVAGLDDVWIARMDVVSTVAFAVVLTVIFAAWYATEKTLSIHSICTRRREAFYWATVLATFALGTAAGDMTAIALGLGFFASGILFAVVIAVPAVGYWRFGLNSIVAFWFAYIVTRPLGASFADWMGVPRNLGGLGLGRGPVALGLTIVIVGFVGYLSVTHKDVEDHVASRSPKRVRRRQQSA